MREKRLEQGTTCQSQAVTNATAPDLHNDPFTEEHIKPREINQKLPVIQKTRRKNLITHCTHEKRFESLKGDTHEVYHNVF